MIIVWVLVLYMSDKVYGSGPTVIDNIASHDECVAAAKAIKVADNYRYAKGICLPVKKVRP